MSNASKIIPSLIADLKFSKLQYIKYKETFKTTIPRNQLKITPVRLSAHRYCENCQHSKKCLHLKVFLAFSISK